MTPDQQRHRRHWDLMTYPEKLRYVSVLFETAPIDEVVWCTSKPFKGHHEWYWMRWDG